METRCSAKGCETLVIRKRGQGRKNCPAHEGIKYRRCSIPGCLNTFQTKGGSRKNCDDHLNKGKGRYQTSVKAPRKPKPTNACATCVYGVEEPRAATGWVCKVNLFRVCMPEFLAKRKVERE